LFDQGIEKYTLEEVIGNGSHGHIWRAFDATLERTVAIKVLTSTDEKAVLQCLKEARHLAKINHPNIVKVYECFHHEDKTFLVMDYLHGQPLGAYISEQCLSLASALSIARQLAGALETVHAAGIVHADIKPSNIMMTSNNVPVLIDFGISNNVMGQHEMDTLSVGTVIPDSVKGTIPYMAPEVVNGDKPTEKSDIFSFGALLFELFTGQRAFSEATDIATLNAVMNNEPKSLIKHHMKVPPEIYELINCMLSKQPEKRPNSISGIRGVLLSKRKLPGRSYKSFLPRIKGVIFLPFLGAAFCGLVTFFYLMDDREAKELSIHQALTTGYKALKREQQKGALQAASSKFLYVLNVNPDNAAAKAGLSLTRFRKYIARDKTPALLQQANVAAEQAFAMDPQLEVAQAAFAWSLELSGQAVAAEKMYKEILAVSPNQFFALEGYIRHLGNQNRLNKALEVAEQAIKSFPDESVFYDEKGSIFFEQQKFDLSIAAFEQSLTIDPDNVFAYSSLSALHYMKGNISKAIASIQEGLSIRPDRVLYSNLGTYYFALGYYRKAATAFEGAINLKSNSQEYLLWANLADAYRWLPNEHVKAKSAYVTALKVLSAEIEKNENNSTLYSRGALYYAKVGDNAAAIKFLHKSLGLAPNDPNVLYRASVTSEVLGLRNNASDFIAQAIEEGYPISVIEGDPELDALRKSDFFRQIILNNSEGK